MAVYQVHGADKNTGEEKSILIAAKTKGHATMLAQKKGLRVSSVMVDISLKGQETTLSAHTKIPGVPQYRWFAFVTNLMGVWAVICILIGAGTMVECSDNQDAQLGLGAIVVCMGIVSLALAAAFSALRAITINSFIWRLRVDRQDDNAIV